MTSLFSSDKQEYDNVFGNTYAESERDMKAIDHALRTHSRRPHASFEEAQAFAERMHLNIMAYSPMGRKYLSVDHTGDTLSQNEWATQFSDTVLRYTYVDSKMEVKEAGWMPDKLLARMDARLDNEKGSPTRKPLYSRDYFRPYGCYIDETQTFNRAIPFKYPAKETGADTSFIYEYLRRISDECYPWLLTWLREKMIHPERKTQVLPIFIGEEGTGKSAFVECLCAALFGGENVLLSDKVDLTRNFNAELRHKLVVSIEEKMEHDRKNPASALKSAVTSSQTRTELKGRDAEMEQDYTEYVMTTNNMVAVPFDGKGDHRRFMVMETDSKFSRKGDHSILADEVFAKMYGYNEQGDKVYDALYNVHTGQVENVAALQQFKYELFHKKDMQVNGRDVVLRKFPHTAAYNRQYDVPRTHDNVLVEQIMRSVIPFITESLMSKRAVKRISVAVSDTETKQVELSAYMPEGAFLYVAGRSGINKILLNKGSAFFDPDTGKPLPPSVVDRAINDLKPWLLKEYGIDVLADQLPPTHLHFRDLEGVAQYGKGVCFALNPDRRQALDDEEEEALKELFKDTVAEAPPAREPPTKPEKPKQERIVNGVIRRYDKYFKLDDNGCLETLNGMKPEEYRYTTENAVGWGHAFLLEADEAPLSVIEQELRRIFFHGGKVIDAVELYKERLQLQERVAEKLFREGKVARVVYSGAKSLHMIVQVKDAPNTKEERRWLDAYLKQTITTELEFDMATHNVLRLTRAPVTMNRVSKYKLADKVKDTHADPWELEKIAEINVSGKQQLMWEDWSHVYDINWRPLYEAWTRQQEKTMYVKTGRVLPSKQIYKDAADAILRGTYFGDQRWNGHRQETFFPAYRLLRMTGWSHDELWGEIKEQVVNTYYNADDKPYWLSRETCRLIKDIDNDSEVDNA